MEQRELRKPANVDAMAAQNRPWRYLCLSEQPQRSKVLRRRHEQGGYEAL